MIGSVSRYLPVATLINVLGTDLAGMVGSDWVCVGLANASVIIVTSPVILVNTPASAIRSASIYCAAIDVESSVTF